MPVTRPVTGNAPGVCPLLIGAPPTSSQRIGMFVGADPVFGPVPVTLRASLAIVRLPWICNWALPETMVPEPGVPSPKPKA